ncbi:MAG: protein kinase [Planctomycetaceae bacterium]|jgi:phosphoglycerate dehydrogenase-like enzyme|nr:protein kinase [Planctomycetaceae bacterium]
MAGRVWFVRKTRYEEIMPNLVVCFKEAPVEDRLMKRIRSAWSGVKIINVGQSGIADALMRADYFCGHAKVPVDWDAVVKQGRLQWIQSSAAGMDWLLVPSVIDADITITTASGVLADQVAEHTLSLILAWMRNLTTFQKEQHDADIPDYRKFIRRPTKDLTELTVGIVGFGGVGRRLAELLVPFRTTILATDLYPADKPAYISQLYPADGLDVMLDRSDVAVLCLPLNEQTRGMFDAKKFQLMHKHTLFVNVARGPLVNTDDLVVALQNEQIAGAVMDVTSPEPLPEDHQLWNFPNVIITPHVGGQSRRRFDDVVDIFAANVQRWQNDLPLINLLTPEGKKLGFPIRSPEHPLWIDIKDWYREKAASTDSFTLTDIPHRKIPVTLSTQRDSTTEIYEQTLTHHLPNPVREGCSEELKNRYYDLLDNQRVLWNEDIKFKSMLGQGGQGVVFLSEQRGTDGFTQPVAIKVFSPERAPNDFAYEEDMGHLAQITAKIAGIQHDHLLAVHDWRSMNRIRFMSMEWVDGFDLTQLLQQEMLDYLQQTVSPERWQHINNVVVTVGPSYPRLMPSIAIPIIRDCLGALGALHREGIVHGDVKPANIMLKRSGNAKLVDIGSAFEVQNRPLLRPFTLAYAAPEVLEGKKMTPRSDIASLGYVLIEMLSGRRLFSKDSELNGLDGRLLLASQLHKILPPAVASSEMLLNFCKSLIAPDPSRRFENAEAADLFKNGAADFLRQLVKGDLYCEPEPEIRNWLEDLENYKP